MDNCLGYGVDVLVALGDSLEDAVARSVHRMTGDEDLRGVTILNVVVRLYAHDQWLTIVQKPKKVNITKQTGQCVRA